MNRPGLRLFARWSVVAAMLLGVFSAYLQPDFLLTLADHLWACF